MRTLTIEIILLLIFLVAPLVGVYPLLLTTILCYGLFACSYNLLAGYGGLVSFGHAMFFGLAGYMTGYASNMWNSGTPVAIAAGVVSAVLVGSVVGTVAIRRGGIYFAMITLAIAQMAYFIFVQAPFTHGEDGIQGIRAGGIGMWQFTSDRQVYYFVLVISVIGYFIYRRCVRSPWGMSIMAIRQNEGRAISLGYNVQGYKLGLIVISSALAGLAGATKAIALGAVTLSDASWQFSGMVILMMLIGGMKTLPGPIIGAAVVVVLENRLGGWGRWLSEITGIDIFNRLSEASTVVMGLIFILCVMILRKGVMGSLIGGDSHDLVDLAGTNFSERGKISADSGGWEVILKAKK